MDHNKKGLSIKVQISIPKHVTCYWFDGDGDGVTICMPRHIY